VTFPPFSLPALALIDLPSTAKSASFLNNNVESYKAGLFKRKHHQVAVVTASDNRFVAYHKFVGGCLCLSLSLCLCLKHVSITGLWHLEWASRMDTFNGYP
jgi:hypothetical protein